MCYTDVGGDLDMNVVADIDRVLLLFCTQTRFYCGLVKFKFIELVSSQHATDEGISFD